MPSAVFLAWASFILAWPLAAASLAISVAAVACALTLSSSPIGRLPFLAPLPTHHGTLRPRPQPESQTVRAGERCTLGAVSAPRGRPQVLGAAETSVDEVVLGEEVVLVVVAFFGSVLVGTDVVLDDVVAACDVVVVVAPFFWVLGLMGGTVVVVVLVVAPGVVAPINCRAWLIAASIALMSDWNSERLPALSAACALV